jgi:hypothetical protein
MNRARERLDARSRPNAVRDGHPWLRLEPRGLWRTNGLHRFITEDLELPHSGFAPENLTTLAHFSVSSAMSFPKSAGQPGSTVPPRSARRVPDPRHQLGKPMT